MRCKVQEGPRRPCGQRFRKGATVCRGSKASGFPSNKDGTDRFGCVESAMTEADLKAMPCSNSQTGRFRSVRFSVSYWKPWPLWKCLESLYQHLNLCGAATASASLYHCQSHYFAVRRIAVPESLNLQARPKREEFDWRRSSANLLRVSDRRGVRWCAENVFIPVILWRQLGICSECRMRVVHVLTSCLYFQTISVIIVSCRSIRHMMHGSRRHIPRLQKLQALKISKAFKGFQHFSRNCRDSISAVSSFLSVLQSIL